MKRGTRKRKQGMLLAAWLASVGAILLAACLYGLSNWHEDEIKVNLAFGKAQDLMMQDLLLLEPRVVDTRIVILGIDKRTLAMQGRWSWPRTVMAGIIDRISSGHPAAIGIDIQFSEPAADPAEDNELAAAIARAGNVVLPAFSELDTQDALSRSRFDRQDVWHVPAVSLPLPAIASAAAVGHINTVPQKSDGVVRSVIPYIEANGVTYGSFDQVLWETAAKRLGVPPEPAGGYSRNAASRLSNYLPPRIDFITGPGGYGYISMSTLLDGSLDPAFFEDAIVLVGMYASGIKQDEYPTPLARKQPMAGVEIHANILQNYMEGRFREESLFLDLLMMLLPALLVMVAGRWLSPIWNLVPLLAGIVGGWLAARALYDAGWVVTLLFPLAAVLLVYLALLVVRYVENRLERKRITSLFGKYVAPEVVRTLIALGEDGLKLGGTRREVTVLFVDVRGFTPLSERTDPETLVQILNEYLNLTATAIFRHKGMLDKFIGDATMAVFNAPIDLPDHRMAAIRAALDMKRGAEALNGKLEARFGMRLHFGIGVHAGPAVIGNIGASFRMDYTAIGDTVNTAARLESNAKPEEILIGVSLYEAMKDRIEAEFAGNLKLKGKAEEMPVYRVTGVAGESADAVRMPAVETGGAHDGAAAWLRAAAAGLAPITWQRRTLGHRRGIAGVRKGKSDRS